MVNIIYSQSLLLVTALVSHVVVSELVYSLRVQMRSQWLNNLIFNSKLLYIFILPHPVEGIWMVFVDSWNFLLSHARTPSHGTNNSVWTVQRPSVVLHDGWHVPEVYFFPKPTGSWGKFHYQKKSAAFCTKNHKFPSKFMQFELSLLVNWWYQLNVCTTEQIFEILVNKNQQRTNPQSSCF